jgi:hypothetical protein
MLRKPRFVGKSVIVTGERNVQPMQLKNFINHPQVDVVGLGRALLDHFMRRARR